MHEGDRVHWFAEVEHVPRDFIEVSVSTMQIYCVTNKSPAFKIVLKRKTIYYYLLSAICTWNIKKSSHDGKYSKAVKCSAVKNTIQYNIFFQNVLGPSSVIGWKHLRKIALQVPQNST